MYSTDEDCAFPQYGEYDVSDTTYDGLDEHIFSDDSSYSHYYFGLHTTDAESISILLKEKVREGYWGIETLKTIAELPVAELKEKYNIEVFKRRDYSYTTYDVDWGEYNHYTNNTYIRYFNN